MPLPSVRALFSPMIAALRETRCLLCAEPTPPQETLRPAGALPICLRCAARLCRREDAHCTSCGEIFAPGTPPGLCGHCLTHGRPWERFFFHNTHQGLLRDAVVRLKYGQATGVGALLGALLAEHPGFAPNSLEPEKDGTAQTVQPYAGVIPIPLHPKRLRQRGFNQAALMAKPLAKRLRIPVELFLLVRTGTSRPQEELPLAERLHNMRGAFSVPPQAAATLAGKRFLLLDDVATTCATLENATRALLEAGAASVDVAVAARTPAYMRCFAPDNAQ